MPNKSDKWQENKPGKFYVDQSCISCDACVCSAPNNFQMNDEDGHAYVTKQPTGTEEEQACREAMEGCPVEAIGNDGES
jgi:ferredoxin